MKQNAIAADLIKRTAAYVPDFEKDGTEDPATRDKPWQGWLDAELGFRNHWYPTEASRNIREGEHKAIKLLGEEILYLRRGGKLHAIEDRCSHRGTKFSMRPITYTDDTITCWHHAFMFDLNDGRIRCILNDPESSLCGNVGIKAYPVREEKGVIFTFVGDMNPPPPLEDDVPPGFFDEDVAVCVADPYVVKANWRLGCEGGYDPGHHYIHNWSKFAINARIPMSFGWVSKKEALLETAIYQNPTDGPRGFTRYASETTMGLSVDVPGKNGSAPFTVTLPIAEGMTEPEMARFSELQQETTVGLWMPCGLKVDPWPFPALSITSITCRGTPIPTTTSSAAGSGARAKRRPMSGPTANWVRFGGKCRSSRISPSRTPRHVRASPSSTTRKGAGIRNSSPARTWSF